MELHKLTFAELDQPPLRGDDPDAVVWRGDENKPDVVAKRVGDWCWFRIDWLATYRFPPTSPDLSVSCVAQADAGASRASVVDGYYRSVVPLALQVYGLEAMHGTAVAFPSGAIALCGFSHAGKTTLTYALSRRGHTVLADDGLVIDATLTGGDAAPVTLQPIPFALMIREPVAEHFGAAVRAKVTVDEDARPTLTVPALPLRAVVLLDRVAGARLHVRRLPQSEAFTTLMAHCYVFSFDDRERKGRMVRAYARFARQVPVYTLTYPDGLEHLDSAAAAVEELAAAEPAAV